MSSTTRVAEEPRRRFRAAQDATLGRYGVDAESRFVPSRAIGGRAHVLVAGDGPPLVLLAGLGLPAAMWGPLLPALDGYRIHAVDLPGHGLSDPGEAGGRDLDRTLERFLDEVLDGLGLGAVPLLGNSFGSRLAIRYALGHEDRVVAIAHVGQPALVLGTSAILPMRLLSTRLGPLVQRLDPASPRQVARLSAAVGEAPLPQSLADLLLAGELLPGHAATVRSMLRQVVRLRGARPEGAVTAEMLGRCSAPATLVLGRDDPFGGPDVGRAVVEALPDADLHVVDGGHAPWFRFTDQVARPVVAFLGRVTGGRPRPVIPRA